MNATLDMRDTEMFHENDLVTWHYSNGKQSFPVAGVVVRQEPDSVIIKARVQDTIKELHVKPVELVTR